MTEFEPVYVFVYGTLKEGYGNHRLLEHCELVGKDLLRIDGLAGSGFPYASFCENQYDETKPWLIGEVYKVTDQQTMNRLDGLEGHPDWYVRTPYYSRYARNVQAYTYPPQKGQLNDRFQIKEWFESEHGVGPEGCYEWNRGISNY